MVSFWMARLKWGRYLSRVVGKRRMGLTGWMMVIGSWILRCLLEVDKVSQEHMGSYPR